MRFLAPAILVSSLLGLLARPAPALALAEGTGLKISGAADIVGNLESKNETKYPRRLDIREAELGVYGPIDHGFDGSLFFAAHNENGAHNLELHEAYLASSKLLSNVRLKAGKFFLGVGRLNQMHRHDWPFLSAPKAHETYFAEEAASDTGLQANVLLPFMPIFTEVGVGVTNGWTYGHSHSQGSRPLRPTHFARIANFFALGESGGMQTGLNYLGRDSRTEGEMKIFGFDAVAKWREGKIVSWLLQAEAYGRNLRVPGATMLERTYGGYFYVERHLFGPLSFGTRFDGYTLVTTGEKNLDYSFVPTLAYRHSEFALFRAAYQLDFEKRAHKNSQVSRVFELQAVFLFGDHPSHDF
jgi:hypothetical protein